MIDRTDAAVLARMRAAEELMRQAGLIVGESDPAGPADPASARDVHLRRAVHWQRYRRGPVSQRQRSCAADIVRGSLRLWSLAGGLPEPVSVQGSPKPVRSRAEVQLARIQLSARVRARCAALRADLAGEAAGLGHRGIAAFDGLVRGRALRAAAECDEMVTVRLSELGLPDGRCPDLPIEDAVEGAVRDCLPPRRRPSLENRLTALLGIGFGAGVSLTAGRLLAQVRPDWMPLGALICGLAGVVLTVWTVVVRRLLAERAAAERWMVETVANLRPVLEERLITRIMLAEAALRDTPN